MRNSGSKDSKIIFPDSGFINFRQKRNFFCALSENDVLFSFMIFIYLLYCFSPAGLVQW